MTRYDPLADLAERWPGWRFECRPLEPPTMEMFTPGQQLIQIAHAAWDDDWELALSHAIAHLDLHLHDGHLPDEFTYEEHCIDADLYAEIRLDREGWRAELL